jgi:hypothetical protein
MESALLEDALRRGTSTSLKDAMSPVRRPVYFAANINMFLALVVILWVGRVGSFPMIYVVPVALLVAILDGLVVLSFADILVSGLKKVLESRARSPLP